MPWDDRIIDIKVVSVYEQIVTMMVKKGGLVKWGFSALYASFHVQFYNLLWSYLSQLGMQINIPWFFMGNWNQVLFASGKKGGKED